MSGSKRIGKPVSQLFHEYDLVEVTCIDPRHSRLVEQAFGSPYRRDYEEARTVGFCGRVHTVLPAGEWFADEPAYFLKKPDGEHGAHMVLRQSELRAVPDPETQSPLRALLEWLA